jgi:predicted nucleotide-binding protein
MRKFKKYKQIRFDANVLSEALVTFKKDAENSSVVLDGQLLSVEHDDSTWNYDTFEEFIVNYRKYPVGSYLQIYGNNYEILISVSSEYTDVSIKAPIRIEIEKTFEILEKNVETSRVLSPLPIDPISPTVFIGHGRDFAWRELKDHLQDKHGIRVEAYETGARAGHTIRDILEDMILKSSFAVIVMTGEDSQENGGLRARQNVIHEAGLFQGKLGFSRAIILLEEGVEEFSNVQGVQYIPFSKENIKETFGEVLATIRREFFQ